jgi:hypothetical protein
MPKRNIKWNKSKYERFLREGRGKGEGSGYKPWISIYDMPSRGFASRIMSNKTGRIHHFFSLNQSRVFYLLSWDDSVLDIREHFPLLDLDASLLDTYGLDMKKYYDEEAPYVLTTTFLVTMKTGLSAISVTNSNELNRKYYIDMLEIIRRYWKTKGIPWKIITNKDIPVQTAKNIEWIISNNGNYAEGLDDVVSLIKERIIRAIKEDSISLNKLFKSIDSGFSIEPGSSLSIFKGMLMSKEIEFDMDKKIDLVRTPNEMLLRVNEGDVVDG